MESIKRIAQQQQTESMIAYILQNSDEYTREYLASLSASFLQQLFEQITPGTVQLDTAAEEANNVRFGPDGKPNPHRRGARMSSWD